MRALFIQISGLIGIISFLNHLWNNASLERTVFVSLAIGFAVYFVLSIGESVIQRILTSSPVSSAPEDAKIKTETLTADTASTSTTETAQA